MLRLLPILVFCAACNSFAGSNEPALPPAEAAAEIHTQLDLALQRVEAGAPDSLQAWSAAHQHFERSLEPRLREVVPAERVLEVEYAFGRIHRDLARGEAPRALVEQVLLAVDGAAGAPEAVASR